MREVDYGSRGLAWAMKARDEKVVVTEVGDYQSMAPASKRMPATIQHRGVSPETRNACSLHKTLFCPSVNVSRFGLMN